MAVTHLELYLFIIDTTNITLSQQWNLNCVSIVWIILECFC